MKTKQIEFHEVEMKFLVWKEEMDRVTKGFHAPSRLAEMLESVIGGNAMDGMLSEDLVIKIDDNLQPDIPF